MNASKISLKILLSSLIVLLLVSGCSWRNGAVTPKEPACGKIILPAEPEGKDIPDHKIVKPNQGISASPSGGVFFPHSAFSVLEFNIKSLRTWISDVKNQARTHNDNVDKVTEKIKKDLENTKKGWLW